MQYVRLQSFSFFFFFNDTATTEIYTLSLHDALPILPPLAYGVIRAILPREPASEHRHIVSAGQAESSPEVAKADRARSEEHTSELQSHLNLVCRLLLEKKKK